jgi:TRAP-type C4-dicarboxylate transport system permease small subunit
MVCLNVFTRYVLKAPIIASIELSRILFVWSCFLAAGITYYKKGHIVISFLFEKFSVYGKKVIRISIYILSMLFFGLLTVWSIQVVHLIWNTEFPILGISQSWLYLPLPLSSLIMLFFSIEFLIESIRNETEAA